MGKNRSSDASLWNPAQWAAMRGKLEKLSLEKLQILADRTGIRFEGGVRSLKNRPGLDAKEQIILVLEETDPAELLETYEALRSEE